MMPKKLTLEPEDLRVDSFDAGAPDGARGTVRGREAATAAATCCTRLQTGCNPDITSIYTGQCCPA
jgi:hypothetical protein